MRRRFLGQDPSHIAVLSLIGLLLHAGVGVRILQLMDGLL